MEKGIDVKKIEEFEKEILDTSKNKEIKYTIDSDIEASVKYDFLSELYSKDKVDSTLKELNLNFSVLSDPELYGQVKKTLENF